MVAKENWAARQEASPDGINPAQPQFAHSSGPIPQRAQSLSGPVWRRRRIDKDAPPVRFDFDNGRTGIQTCRPDAHPRRRQQRHPQGAPAQRSDLKSEPFQKRGERYNESRNRDGNH